MSNCLKTPTALVNLGNWRACACALPSPAGARRPPAQLRSARGSCCRRSARPASTARARSARRWAPGVHALRSAGSWRELSGGSRRAPRGGRQVPV